MSPGPNCWSRKVTALAFSSYTQDSKSSMTEKSVSACLSPSSTVERGNHRGAPLGHLKTDEVADVLQVAKVRILKVLERRGAVRVMPDALEIDDGLAARDPVLARLAVAAVAGLPAPAGPRPRRGNLRARHGRARPVGPFGELSAAAETTLDPL